MQHAKRRAIGETLRVAAGGLQIATRAGATKEQPQEAVLAVGDDPARVHEHLLRQGASAGPG